MEHKPVNVNEIITEFKDQLIPQYGENEVMQFLYILFDTWKGWPKAKVHLGRMHELKEEEVVRFNIALQELKKNNPIQYIVGETFFQGLRLKVNPDVLIPRPETEELVGVAEANIRSENSKDLSILDIGTGSGCIAITLKKKFPDSKVTAVDISFGALRTARENAAFNNCDIRFLKKNILDEKAWKDFSTYRVIISNPPYVPEMEKKRMGKNVLDYEPSIALFVPDENPLLYYRAITRFALIHLESSGRLYFEINERFAHEIKTLLISQGFRDVEVLPDINQKLRFAKAER